MSSVAWPSSRSWSAGEPLTFSDSVNDIADEFPLCLIRILTLYTLWADRVAAYRYIMQRNRAGVTRLSFYRERIFRVLQEFQSVFGNER